MDLTAAGKVRRNAKKNYGIMIPEMMQGSSELL